MSPGHSIHDLTDAFTRGETTPSKVTDAYLADWRRADAGPCGDDLETEAQAAADRLETEYDNSRLALLAQNEGRA